MITVLYTREGQEGWHQDLQGPSKETVGREWALWDVGKKAEKCKVRQYVLRAFCQHFIHPHNC